MRSSPARQRGILLSGDARDEPDLKALLDLTMFVTASFKSVRPRRKQMAAAVVLPTRIVAAPSCTP